MAATVIDSFVVELGLDPAKFNAEQKKAVNSFRKSQDELESRAQSVDQATARAGGSIAGFARQAAGLLGAATAGKFMVQFATDTISAAAATNQLSKSIGVNVETISKWQGVAKLFGGDAGTMANNLTRISDVISGFQVGKIDPMMADLRAIAAAGGVDIDPVKRGTNQTLIDLADALKNIADKDPARAGFLARQLGLDPASIEMLMQGGDKLRQQLASIKALTKENADEATKLTRRWNEMMTGAQRLGMKAVFGTIDAGSAFFNKLNTGNAKGDVGDDINPYTGKKVDRSDRFAPPAATAASSAGGAFTSQAEKEAFIRETARKNGIDPDVAMKVARSEGFNNFVSTVPGERSYGAFQLNRSKTSRPSLGDMFAKDTGLDPSDPSTEKRGIEYALKYAATSGRGWADWYGAKNTGIGQYQGIGQAGGSQTTTIDTVNVYTNGTNGQEIAQDFRKGVTDRQSRAANANNGGQ